MNKNLDSLKSVAQILGDISKDVVFVGGATVELYINDKAAPTPQPSEDVDCVVEILTYKDWIQFEEKLRAKGFQDYDISGEDTEAPTCRKYVLGMKVDFMPIEESVLGYSNPWFREGVDSAVKVKIEEVEIQIFKIEFFLAAKLQAFFDRGLKDDIRFSQDLEDITELFDGVTDIEDCIGRASSAVKIDIKNKLLVFIKKRIEIEEAMIGFLGYDDINTKTKRVERIFEIIKRVTLDPKYGAID